jgi:hypothetical protein
MAEEPQEIEKDEELDMLEANRQDGFNYQERRHDDWKENYTLSRDKVITNRLIQRQSVNLPLMKTMIRTLLKDVDDMPIIHFENLDNNKQAEIFKNEYWKHIGELNKFEIQDIVDKRQVFHYGRSFDQWQVINGSVNMEITDPIDILVSRYTDPTNIHSSRFLIHQNIFVPLSKLKQNPNYDKDELAKIEAFFASEQGLIKQAKNVESLEAKNEKMRDMGLLDVDHPILGETYVELELHFLWREGDEGSQIWLYVLAENRAKLMKKPLEEIIGKTVDHFWQTHYPYNTWADDVEKQDFWSDGVADMVRTPNKILNAWFSQLVENRTLKNLNMNVFNSSIEGYSPQTWDPKAWGMYGIPVPANQTIRDVFMPLPVADLSESLDEMNFIIAMVEKATGAVPTQQGAVNQRSVTLGEVKLAVAEAKERIKGMSKFYTQVWKERGLMFLKLVEAAEGKLDAVKIYKKGLNTDDIYSREISPKDWKTPLGYRCKVWDQAEKNEEDTQKLEKITAVSSNIPGNLELEKIKQRKLLEWAGLTPDEINDILQAEEEKRQQMLMAGQATPATLMTPGQPMGTPPAPGPMVTT